jgi:branched-chain amino acid transport system ATP-binding protein
MWMGSVELQTVEGEPDARLLLDTLGLEVVYQDVIQALHGVSLRLPRGEIIAILGPNGAGKTTFLRAVTGLLDFHKGEILGGSVHFDGVDVTDRSAADLVGRGVSQVLEGRRIFPTLSVEENIAVGAQGKPKPAAVQQVLDLFPVLADRRRQPGGYLSGGEQQMLAMARALVSEPKLLVLDEPSLGLAPKLVDQVFDIIRQINKAGTSILLVEQNAAVALDVASHAYVMESGRVVLDGTSEEVLGNADILEFYLGMTEGGERRSYADVKHYRRRKRWLS